MKKSIVKALSAFLALVLILSVLPMAAFAAETDAHEHSALCSCEESGIMPASIICPDGNHLYRDGGVAIYSSATEDGKHHVEILDACVVCLYRRSETPLASYDEDHSYTKTQIGEDNGVAVYRYSCACGDSYYGT